MDTTGAGGHARDGNHIRPALRDGQWRLCCLDADEELIIWAEANETTG